MLLLTEAVGSVPEVLVGCVSHHQPEGALGAATPRVRNGSLVEPGVAAGDRRSGYVEKLRTTFSFGALRAPAATPPCRVLKWGARADVRSARRQRCFLQDRPASTMR